MVTKVLEKCDICGKECKSVKQHKAASHREPEGTTSSGPEQQRIDREVIKGAIIYQKVNRSVEDIAKILHESITTPLGLEHGFNVQEWGSFDPAGYLKVAREIKG